MNPYTRRGMGDAAAAAPQPAAPVEEEYIIRLNRTLTALESAADVGRDIDKDGDFLLTHVWGSSTGLYTIQLRSFTGRNIASAPIFSQNFVGTVSFKTALKPMLYPGGSRISVDLVDVSGAPNTVELLLGGTRYLRQR